MNNKDQEYLKEKRNSTLGLNQDNLAFYYFHKSAMESILKTVKQDELRKVGVVLSANDKVQASLRRPFKKGARTLGGSSRADEIHIGGIRGIGELFLKILHEIEDSIITDSQISTQGLIEWNNQPSQIGQVIDIKDFFTNHNYGKLGRNRPSIKQHNLFSNSKLLGKWDRSKEINLKSQLKIDPLWCYTSGLYLAEGTTKKEKLFLMFKGNVTGLAFGFTSSENNSLELILKALNKLFEQDDCLSSWKVKVGSQYLPELVVTGLKNGVPMLRGGNKGQGKLRTMEISLGIKEWALSLAPCLQDYTDKYSHVEPTGAGLPRIDFSASSVLCRWYFPLIMYATFGQKYSDPTTDFN